MAISSLFVSGYRSIRRIVLPLSSINVLVGPNGCGKTNLYRSMYLLCMAAEGRLAAAIVDEGGMPSILWAGARRKGPVRMRMYVRTDQAYYEMVLGLSTDRGRRGFFTLDPAIKEERFTINTEGERSVTMLERKNRSVWLRDAEGVRVPYRFSLLESESVLAQLQEPHRYPELLMLRHEFSRWRFYHQFRTDAEAPIRRPQSGTITPVLSHDGHDLATALATIIEIGRIDQLQAAIDDAFPGARLDISTEAGQFLVHLTLPGIQRPFTAQELSDGTLRYLCLVAALLSPRPAALVALNEPETSLHPDLLPALSRLLCQASASSQIWVTTHSRTLAGHIAEFSGQSPTELEMVDGETRIVGSQAIEPEEDVADATSDD